MASRPKSKITGRIILVQETRFQIISESGRSYLFSLAHNASASAEDTIRWHNDNEKVMVIFEGRPALASGIAHTVKPIVSQDR